MDVDGISRATEYAKRRGLKLGDTIGFGQDGIVLATHSGTAVKALRFENLYRKELAVYLRLKEKDIGQLCGFYVPRLIGHHDELMVIEMEFVTPPFIVDFASAGVDFNPLAKYDREQRIEQEETWAETFENRWPVVKSLLSELRSLGIYLSDVNANNIRFAPEPELP
ncbi:MAG: hypothetical protein EXS05_00825 [Planctomycetaceae bacterium]|nr:hypothetical protein [Planctomycetaceae bacterium]